MFKKSVMLCLILGLDAKLLNILQNDVQQRQQLATINKSLICPDEEKFRTINGKCYLFVAEKKVYLDAKAYCEGFVAKVEWVHLCNFK